uniref:Putative abcb10 transporter n=2 Tax=Ixodes ricinus TaxID=34613 RepID=A0A090XDV5_IXORI
MSVLFVNLCTQRLRQAVLQRNTIRWTSHLRSICSSKHNVRPALHLGRCVSSVPRPTGKKSGDLRRLLRHAKPERGRLTVAVVLLFVSSSVMIAFPFCIGKMIDVIYTSSGEADLRENLNRICTILAGVVVIGGLANFGRVYLMNNSAQRIIHSLRRQAHASIIQQEVAFFDRSRTGDLVTRLSSDTALIGMSLTQNISDGLRSSIAVLGGVGMMVYTSSHLALVGLSVVPPVAAASFVFARRLKQVAVDVQSRLAQTSAIAEEQFSNVRTVRSFAKEEYEKSRYTQGLHLLLDRINTETTLKALFFGCTGATGNMIVLAVLYYGGLLMSRGELTVGSLSSFLLYAAYVGVSIGGLGSLFHRECQGTRCLQENLGDCGPYSSLTGGRWQDPGAAQGSGRVSRRHFLVPYTTRRHRSVNNVEPFGSTRAAILAVVGPSGQGKSTLAALLLRLYDPTSGLIMLDGVDVRELDPRFLRTSVGIVSQEPTLFAASIYDNILYGSKDPAQTTRDDVVQAAREANALDFIEALPDGFDTLVGERGVLLSGGQKQRVAIARAILRDPRVLVLDEATSSLDAVSERAVQQALERLMRGRTVLTIAHRLSTVRRASNIAVLKGGSIVESGTFDELVHIPGGLFRTLVEHQIQDDPVDEQSS